MARVNGRSWRDHRRGEVRHTREIRSDVPRDILDQLHARLESMEARASQLEADNKALRMTLEQVIAGYHQVEADLRGILAQFASLHAAMTDGANPEFRASVEAHGVLPALAKLLAAHNHEPIIRREVAA